jgi:hypothetical protein
MMGWAAGRSLSSMSHDCSDACCDWLRTGFHCEKYVDWAAAGIPLAERAMTTVPDAESVT